MVRIPRQWSLKLWETGKASSKRLELQQRASESATWTPAELISQRRRHDTLPIEKIDRLYTYRRQWSLNAFHPSTSSIRPIIVIISSSIWHRRLANGAWAVTMVRLTPISSDVSTSGEDQTSVPGALSLITVQAGRAKIVLALLKVRPV